MPVAESRATSNSDESVARRPSGVFMTVPFNVFEVPPSVILAFHVPETVVCSKPSPHAQSDQPGAKATTSSDPSMTRHFSQISSVPLATTISGMLIHPATFPLIGVRMTSANAHDPFGIVSLTAPNPPPTRNSSSSISPNTHVPSAFFSFLSMRLRSFQKKSAEITFFVVSFQKI